MVGVLIMIVLGPVTGRYVLTAGSVSVHVQEGMKYGQQLRDLVLSFSNENRRLDERVNQWLSY